MVAAAPKKKTERGRVVDVVSLLSDMNEKITIIFVSTLFLVTCLFSFFHRSIIWSLMISIFFFFASSHYFFPYIPRFFVFLFVFFKKTKKQLTGIIWRLIGEWFSKWRRFSIIRLVHRQQVLQMALHNRHAIHFTSVVSLSGGGGGGGKKNGGGPKKTPPPPPPPPPPFQPLDL